MPKAFEPGGVWPAIVTPFADDASVDFDALRRMCRFVAEQGVDGIVPCGTTGESPTLSLDEQVRVVETVIHEVGDRVGVLAGAGSNSTEKTIQAAKRMQDAGASGLLLVDCYYNGPSTSELRTEYYERVLSAVDTLPIVPYVIPGRTGCALAPEDLALMHQRSPERVVAVKEATGDLARMRRERELAGNQLSILSGDDEMTLSMMSDSSIGGAGVVSVMANLLPAGVVEMVRLARDGKLDEAKVQEKKLAPILSCVGVKAETTRELASGPVTLQELFRNPVPLKTMMAGLGMIGSRMRPPLGSMASGAIEVVRSRLRSVFAAHPELLQPIEETFGVKIEERLASDRFWQLR